MVSLKTQAKGLIAPGTPQSSLVPGKYSVKLTKAVGENDGLFATDEKGEHVLVDGKPVPATSEFMMVTCVYPDEFIKSHQVKDTTDLVSKATSLLRNRYGITGNINVLKAPSELKENTSIDIEITGA